MALTKEILVDQLIKSGYLKTSLIIDAFKKIDRKDFVLEEYRDLKYINEALPIGFRQTISQPLTVAFMLELLEPKPREKILDVGSGSGWTTALLGFIVGMKGKVFGTERISELVKFGQENISKYSMDNVQIQQAEERLGYRKEAPYDKILVSAASDDLPEMLVEQLKIGGRMVLPIKNSVWKIDKVSEYKFEKEKYFGFSFVPLIKN